MIGLQLHRTLFRILACYNMHTGNVARTVYCDWDLGMRLELT